MNPQSEGDFVAVKWKREEARKAHEDSDIDPYVQVLTQPSVGHTHTWSIVHAPSPRYL